MTLRRRFLLGGVALALYLGGWALHYTYRYPWLALLMVCSAALLAVAIYHRTGPPRAR